MKSAFFCYAGAVVALFCVVCFQQIDGIEDKTVFARAIEWMHKHPVKSRELAEKLTGALLKSKAEQEFYVEALTDIIVQPLADSQECNFCELLMTIFKTALQRQNYTDLEDDLIYYCEFLLVAQDQRIQAKELCGGLIPLQAPHVARVLTTPPVPENREICEFLNDCLPETTTVYRLPHKKPQSSSSSSKSQKRRHKRKRRSLRRKRRSVHQHQQQQPDVRALNDTIRIVQLTDIHLEKGYDTNSLTECWRGVCCKAEYGTGDAKHYGSYECNVPQRTMELFFQQVVGFAPDVVIFSGDIPPHTWYDETLESQLNCTVTLTNTLSRILGPDTRVYPCVGNHEFFPTNLFSVSQLPNATGTLLSDFARLWTPLAAFSQDEIDTMEEAGYYTKLLGIGNLRIVAMNTQYMYTSNYYNPMNHNDFHSGGEVTRFRAAIVSILAAARENNEKVIFVGHHVPGNSDFIVKASIWYQEVMNEFSDIIVLHMSGHTHTDEFRLIFNENGTATSMIYVSPSMDPHGYRNPSMRIYYLDKTTYEVLDYEQYFFDIKDQGLGDEIPPPTIVRLYSAKDEYNLPDLSPQSWLELLERFQADPVLLQTHRSHADANARDFESYACTGECVTQHICRQLHSSYDGYVACTTPEPEATTTLSTITWPIITEYQTTVAPAVKRRNRPRRRRHWN